MKKRVKTMEEKIIVEMGDSKRGLDLHKITKDAIAYGLVICTTFVLLSECVM